VGGVLPRRRNRRRFGYWRSTRATSRKTSEGNILATENLWYNVCLEYNMLEPLNEETTAANRGFS
jgi:hypothetical protein